jgi:glycosyltransferase involved in cell wall biosynthesis
VTVDTTAAGTDFEKEQANSLSVEIVDDYAGVETYLKGALSSADVITHLYFHEPEHNPVSKSVADSGTPFVIGMCEIPHPRFSDEVSGIERIPLVRSVGRRLLKPRFKRTLRRADKLVVVDEHARDYYSQYLPREHIEIVPYGVRLDRFVPSPFPDTPRVLMVNRLIERRGVDHMIEAFQQVRRAFSDAELHLVGDGPRREKLSELAQE